MAELEVIYDPAKEIAAIVNVETRQGWGPAMIGPNAAMILSTFIDVVPFDLTIMSSYDAQTAFAEFLRSAGLDGTATPDAAPEMAQVSSGDTSVGAADQLAELEATNASDVPPVAPADTDMEGDAGTTDTVVQCVNCNGTGSVELEEPGVLTTCGMCRGSGKLTVTAVAE